MMRHPIDRVESHVAHNIRQGRKVGRKEQIMAAIEVSRYGNHLDRYRAFMKNLYKFIDMPPLLEKLNMKRNVGVDRDGLLTAEERLFVADRTIDDTRRLISEYGFNQAQSWVADLELTLAQ
jgi:hypothetical protein